MKEHEFINIIKNLTKSSYIGDDCAYLKDLDIVVTQDNFIEDVHFKREWSTPYQIGYKAAIVNISDILASGAEPSYLSVGLSLPNVDSNFVEALYKGIIAGANGAKIIGGDITKADKVFISITAIGKTSGRKISSRKNAKPGYIVISNGEFGISTKGLNELIQGKRNTPAIKTHLEPKLDTSFSENISKYIKDEYAMMDTSDGLADALFQIAKSSNVKITTKKIEGMFGAEDYNLVAAIPKDFLPQINNFKIIGQVNEYDGCYLEVDDEQFKEYQELKLFDHFGE